MADSPFPLFTYCKFIINDQILQKDGELFKLFTNTLNFKIIGIDPLVVEKYRPSQEDLSTLVEALKSFLPLNCKKYSLEDSPGETFKLRATKEYFQRGDWVPMSPNQTDEYEQLTKFTKKPSDATNTDIHAVGKTNDKHNLIKIYTDFTGNDVSAHQEISAKTFVEGLSSEDKTAEETVMLSSDNKQDGMLSNLTNITEEVKETLASQVITRGSEGADKSSKRISHAGQLNGTFLPSRGMYKTDENLVPVLLEKDSFEIPWKQVPRKTKNNETMVTVTDDHFEKNWTNPSDPRIAQRDWDVANTHLYSTIKKATNNSEQSPQTSKTASSISTKTPGVSTSSFIPGNSSAGGPVSSTSEKREEQGSAYQIGNFTIRTDSRPAFDLSSVITVTVGKPFDKLSGLRDFRVADNKKTQEIVKNKFTMFNVYKPKSHHKKQLCALLPDPDDEDKIKEALENLNTILQDQDNKIFAQNIRSVVLTSCILYKEPFHDQNLQHSYDRKKVGYFAKCLFEFLNSASEMSNISLTLVGCEEALSTVHKVIESRHVKKISPEVQKGAGGKTSEDSQYNNQRSYTEQHYWGAGQGSDNAGQHCVEESGSFVALENTCGICFSEKLISPVKCCSVYLCESCQQKLPTCPNCRTLWRILTGDQPPGTMLVKLIHDSAAGYEPLPTWQIKYNFPAGKQMDCHPNPGTFYTGTNRTAFLPASEEGFRVLKLLRLAFLRKLTFTMGRPLTTDTENSIVWNHIHHKTNLLAGEMYGYPDANYLDKVTKELASKGVTLNSLSADEIPKIKNFEHHIETYKRFTDSYPI